MKTLSKAFAKSAIAAAAAGAVAVSAASPAAARDIRGHSDNGISAGDVVAGALVIGGIAAIASTAGKDRYDYDRAGYDGQRWDRDDRAYGYGRGRHDGYGNPREAVAQCVAVAERAASHRSYGRADVTDIRDVDRDGRGYTVRGRIAVNSMGRGWRQGDADYGRGWGNDRRGWNSSLRGYDSGSFKCRVEYGRVVDVDFSGIRGL